MESLFWHLANRTAETEFIFNLFHLLLAGLTLVVLLYQLRGGRENSTRGMNRLLPLGFFLLVVHFALLTGYFGATFFFRKELEWATFERLAHGLMACGLLVVSAAYLRDRGERDTRYVGWTLLGCAVVTGVLTAEILFSLPRSAPDTPSHSLGTLATDLLALLAVGLGVRAIIRSERPAKWARVVALASVGIALLLHSAPVLLPLQMGIVVWNAEQHMLSVSLFAFAWAVGERSGNLLDRVFVRLNLTFIVLASVIMLITAGMEKYQYLRLAEERSMDLAEFLRGHIVYYRSRGESLQDMFQRPELLRRVVIEFGTLPELRQVHVYLDGRRTSFHYTPDWEIQQETVSLGVQDGRGADTELANGFRMIHLPIASESDPDDRIEFIGTMDHINEYIGRYIILIYTIFTVMVGLASGIIGIIVSDTDRRLRRQYAELQDTHQQLAQASKLASVGELAGGVAHEINTPITSILSLGSHLSEGKATPTMNPRDRKSLQLIVQQAERVSNIVRNLLTFARQSHLEVTRVDVSQLLRAAIDLIQYRLRGDTVRLRREIVADLPPVLGDSSRLTEVFVNLLNNAIDAMTQGGTIVVRAFRNPEPDGGVRVEIEDTGAGIAPELIPRIFDPFFTTKNPGQGTGLGLSISHGIIKDHGGQIWAESQPGVGTTLVATLPGGGDRR